jgi:myo-inositol-1(or 4)-monophosphatase
MKFTDEDLNCLCDAAICGAKKAGDIISSFVSEKITVDRKDSGTSWASQVVTEVDLICQEVILRELHSATTRYNLGLLTEESEDDKSRFEKECFWCIDPMDGTLSFLKSDEGYSVSIALISHAGESVIGVVYDPFSETLYHAIVGKGIYKDGKYWCPQGKDNVLTLVIDASFLIHPKYEVIMIALDDVRFSLGYDSLQVISQGGAVMNAVWVLENNPACYFKIPKKGQGGGSVWDYAATTCLFNELPFLHGDIEGNKLKLNPSETTYFNVFGILYASEKALGEKIIKLFRESSLLAE